MVYRYVPILRWKQGERRGLGQLQALAKSDVIPLFQFAADQYRPPRGNNPLGVTPAQAFANEVAQCWGTAPFYLDATSVPIGAAAAHPLVDLASAARAAGLNLIPATVLGAPTAYQSAVQAVHAIDGRGAALRVDLAEFSSAGSWATSLPLPFGAIDLIADFRSSIGLVSSMGPAVTATFHGLHNGTAWRTVTIAGTSIPADFSGYAAGLHLLPRVEWALWSTLSSAGLPYRLDYGDYATVSLAAPPSGIAWGYPINVKYTLQNAFLVCRGVKTTGRGSILMAPQLVSHANSIVTYPTRMPIANCWADELIDRIASGLEQPGNLETWVRIGVNRHVERVRADLP